MRKGKLPRKDLVDGCPDRSAFNSVLRAVTGPSLGILADMTTVNSCQLLSVTGTQEHNIDVADGALNHVNEAK